MGGTSLNAQKSFDSILEEKAVSEARFESEVVPSFAVESVSQRETHTIPKSLRLRSLQSVREVSNGARTKSNRVRVCLNRVRSSFEETRIILTATLCVFADGGFRAFALADLPR